MLICFTEKKARFQVFRDNLKKIKFLNDHEKGTARYGATQFADLTGKYSLTYIFCILFYLTQLTKIIESHFFFNEINSNTVSGSIQPRYSKPFTDQ